ncbi:hypothetical protein Cantr_03162 [Candida viswanathii]|uniref:Uncharacterized protein n=1 Tax=Candida viswanathii TaxID=5486 RepID=A0A367YLH1_9ASCO|nr:hypothetical protein Cantr_03162 [Candida viswanathii]
MAGEIGVVCDVESESESESGAEIEDIGDPVVRNQHVKPMGQPRYKRNHREHPSSSNEETLLGILC